MASARCCHVSAAFLLCTALALLAGCGDDAVPEGDAGDDAAELEDVPGFDVFLEDGGVTGVVPEGAAASLLVRVWCENRVRCGCSFTTDVEECVAALLPSKETEYAGYREMGLTYDAACVSAKIDEILVVGCGETISPLAYPPVCLQCPIYYGGAPLGSECMLMGTRGFTTCEQGMECSGELGSTTCGPACDARAVVPIRVGEPCDEESAEGCTVGGGHCEDGVCQPLPTVGEPCLETACGPGASCDADTCVVSTAVGEPCQDSHECVTGICLEGKCSAICYRPIPF